MACTIIFEPATTQSLLLIYNPGAPPLYPFPASL